MRNSPAVSALLVPAVLVLGMAGASAQAESPAAPEAGANDPAALRNRQTTAPDLIDLNAPEPPTLQCYRQAQRIARRQSRDPGIRRSEDAYACDLAVQVARDEGSASELAAALTNRAIVLAADSRLEPALADLNAALQQTPDDPAIYGDLGNLLLRLDRPADALAAHDRAVELAPSDPRTYYNRTFSYRALGQTERAAEDLAAARSLLRDRRRIITPAETPAPDDSRGR